MSKALHLAGPPCSEEALPPSTARENDPGSHPLPATHSCPTQAGFLPARTVGHLREAVHRARVQRPLGREVGQEALHAKGPPRRCSHWKQPRSSQETAATGRTRCDHTPGCWRVYFFEKRVMSLEVAFLKFLRPLSTLPCSVLSGPVPTPGSSDLTQPPGECECPDWAPELGRGAALDAAAPGSALREQMGKRFT